MGAGVIATVRKTRGDDIDGACGATRGPGDGPYSPQAASQRPRHRRETRQLLIVLLALLGGVHFAEGEPARERAPRDRRRQQLATGAGQDPHRAWSQLLRERPTRRGTGRAQHCGRRGQELCSRLQRARPGAHGAEGGRSSGEDTSARRSRIDPSSSEAKNNYGMFLVSARTPEGGHPPTPGCPQEPLCTRRPDAASRMPACARASPVIRRAAEEYFLKALKLNPNQPQALYNLAEINYQRDD